MAWLAAGSKSVKLLAQSINATSIIQPRNHILIKLPYLVALDREQLSLSLGDDVEVSRTAVELQPEKDIWQWRLIDVLKALQAVWKESVGV